MINAKVSDVTFGDLDDGMNNYDMVALEHEILVESEQERLLLTVLICWGYNQLRFIQQQKRS